VGRQGRGDGKGAQGHGWRGLGLFLLGALVGGLATWAGCPDAARRVWHGGPVSAWLDGVPAAEPAAEIPGGEPTARRHHAAGRGAAAGPRRAAPSSERAEAVPSSGEGGEEVGPGLAGPAPGKHAGPGAPAAEAVPAASPEAGFPSPPAREPAATRIALVIDDLGRSLEDLENLRRLGVPLTYAVLPFESQTPEVVATLHQRHEEILCHLPMEPRNGGDPGPGALRIGMSRDQLRQATQAALAAVPGAAGVNNHMGSGLSADAPSMAAILGVLGAKGLFFLDSRTSAQSVAYRLATSLGIPAAERQVFLDDDLSPDAVTAQFHRLLDLARTRGEAIAIGHPHSITLATLALEVPRAQALGYHFVRVSALLDRPTPAPLGTSGR
jgi:polysaccharide deacetylase 2 family uncharacterized protein YibQ